MDAEHATQLGRILRQARAQLHISAREVADRSGMADSNVLRLEQGAIANPRPETLKALADTLSLDLADLYAAAGYVQPAGLPSFAPYLRSRYPNLPASAKRELEATFRQVTARHDYEASTTGRHQERTSRSEQER